MAIIRFGHELIRDRTLIHDDELRAQILRQGLDAIRNMEGVRIGHIMENACCALVDVREDVIEELRTLLSNLDPPVVLGTDGRGLRFASNPPVALEEPETDPIIRFA